MEKEFVPYEQALALKELGFDETCMRGWYKDGGIWYHPDSDIILDNPTFSQAFRWFREKYGLQAEILWRGDMECFCYKTGKFKYGSHDFSKDDYKTYEEAELECLKKLISIVKEK